MSKVTNPGRFVWREIFTPDIEKTTNFYTSLFGWTVNKMDMGPMQYHMIMKGETGLGGIMSLEAIKQDGVPPHWLPYVSVPNIDECVEAVKGNGGMVPMGPMDVPNMGKFAVVSDPLHAYSAGWQSAQDEQPLPEKPPVWTWCWEQLNTADPEKVVTFYQKVYGWTKAPFGDSDDMWVFNAGDVPAASLMKAPDGVPSHWLSYVAVEDLDATKKKVTELGGKILMDLIEVPSVGKIAVVQDNIGATIGLFVE